MKIVSHRDASPDEYQMSVSAIGGPNDGEIFRTVVVTLEDGREGWAWLSNTRSGYFKQIFVPWDWEPPPMVSGSL
ncbi:MAG TPA: hypothetical protein VFU31_21110 [Candidatus Binatia bacterium]|nr:hypothetical protein [Candidatus Binatia bacterium]